MEIQHSSYYKCDSKQDSYLNSFQSILDKIALSLEQSKYFCLTSAKALVSEKFLQDVLSELESKGFEVTSERWNNYTPTYLLTIFIK